MSSIQSEHVIYQADITLKYIEVPM